METLKPLFNNVLLKRVADQEVVTASGLVIAGSPKTNDAWRCEVIEVGPGEQTKETGLPDDEGNIPFLVRPLTAVKPGDIVYVPAFNGYKVMVGSRELLLVKDTEIIVVVSRAS